MGGRSTWSPLIPAAYRALAAPLGPFALTGAGAIALAFLASVVDAAPGAAFWIRAELTVAALTATICASQSLRGTRERVRIVRTWLTAAIGLWFAAEVVQNIEIAAGSTAAPALSNVPFVVVLACAGGAYAAALRGHLRPREELAVYLDGAIVFFAAAAVMLTLFGETAATSIGAGINLAYAIFFVATTGATLVLDLAVRAERRPSGPYVVLLGLVLLGVGFVWRVVAPITGQEVGAPAHFEALGVFVVMLGTITWTDAVDTDAAYTQLAARLRSALPLVAVGLMPPLVAIFVARPVPGILGILTILAIGLVLVSVAIRQSVLLRDREEAFDRQQELSNELTSAEAKYRALVERQPGVVYLAEPGIAGRWLYVSPQVEAMLGFARQAWIDDSELWAQRIHPDDRERVLREEAIPVSERLHASMKREYRLLAADGHEVWVLEDESVAETNAEGTATLMQGVLLDITERKDAERALRLSEEQQRRIIETASYAFVGMGRDGRVIDWNQQATDTFGWTRAEALGRTVAELIIPEAQRATHERGMRHYLATGEGPILSKRIEVTAVDRAGREFPVELTIWPIDTGGEIRFNALVDDISTRRKLEDQLREQALHDPLTTLANRVLFVDRIHHALERDPEDGLPAAAVLALNLDDFKMVNNSLGHACGDDLLRAVATRLRVTARQENTAARIGGDEFAILLERPQPEDAEDLASRILESMSRPFELDGQVVSIHVSIGIAISGQHGALADELLRNADLAMYRAKARGKNRWAAYETGMHEQTLRGLSLRRRLAAAVANEQLEVHYQPIVALSNGAVVGLEALLRWRDEDGQFVPPSEIIPLAEETGLILPIGRFVLERACRDAQAWQAELRDGETLDIAVNVSGVQLEDASLIADIDRALSLSGLPAGALIIEITESALSTDSLSTIRSLRAIRARGIRTALDDFGTGYSSLARLRRFPVEMVKIDREFVGAMVEEREAALVQSIIDLGRNLSMSVVAEGIENIAQLSALRTAGATLGQGYYFSKPLPPDAVGPMLAIGHLPLPRRGPRLAVELGA